VDRPAPVTVTEVVPSQKPAEALPLPTPVETAPLPRLVEAVPSPAPVAAVRLPEPDLPKLDIAEVLKESGLVLVETDNTKAASNADSALPPDAPIGRKPRHAVVAVEETPLVQVETRN